VMAEFSHIERQSDDLVIRCKIMGAMSTSVYVRPEEAFAALRLLTSGLVLYLPVFLFKGWRRWKKLHTKATLAESLQDR